MRADELPAVLGEVRALTGRYLSGTTDGFAATRDLLSLLLHATVLHDYSFIRFTTVNAQNQRAATIGAWRDPLLLNNGAYLQLLVSLKLDDVEGGRRKLRVYSSSYQYQLDRDGDDWVFRYDYARTPRNQYAAAHLQVRANLLADCLPVGTPLERVHMPTGRVPIEGVIRALIEDYGVEPNEKPEIWRPILAESEGLFEKIAHRPGFGPAA